MATETIRFQFRSGVATLTADIYPAASDTVAQSGRTCTEATYAKTWYTFTITTGETGLHRIVFKDSSQTPQEIGSAWCLLTGTAVTIETYDDPRTIYLPAATAGEAGGVFIAGSNAATTLARLTISDVTTLNSGGGGNPALKINDGVLISAGTYSTSITASNTVSVGALTVVTNAVAWNADWDTEVESEVNDALVANNLDHLCKTATAAADMTTEVADNTILARILANGDTSVFDPSTDGLQPIRDRGDSAWITSTLTAQQVWEYTTRTLSAFGFTVAATGNWSTHSASDVAALILATPANKLATDASGYVTYANAAPPAASTIASQVRTELETELGRIDAAITSRQATVANLANAVTMAAKFDTMVVLDGAVYDFTTAALAAGPSGGLDAAGVRTAIGLASANLDTQLSTINGYVDCLPASWVVPAAASSWTPSLATNLGTLVTDWTDGGRLDLLLDSAAADGGGGGGAHTQTVTVTCSAVPVQGATVDILSGSTLIDRQTTNASGVATPACDAGTYTLRVTKAGLYASSSTTITVTAAAARAVSLTAITIAAPSDDDTVTGWIPLYDATTAADPGATAIVRQWDATARRGMANTERTWTANAQGIASGTLWLSESYQWKYGSASEWSDPFIVEDDGDGTFRMPGGLG